MLRTVLWIAGPALVLGIGGWLYVTSGRYASTDNAYVQADHVTIAPQVGGRVVEVEVRENQAVKKGDVLFRIDPEPLEIAYARMQAQVESVASLLDAARSGYASAQADVRSSAADLKYKQQQYQRMQELRGRGLIAQQALDTAANDLAAARARQDANNAAVAKAKNMLGGLPTTPDAQLAGYKLAQAQLAQARLDLDHATVRAPMDGIIGKTTLQPGDFLAIGQAAMPLVANTLWVERELQGNRPDPRARRPAGDDRSRHLPGQEMAGARRLDQPGLRRRVLAAAGAERDRQLGQDRAAHPGAPGDPGAGPRRHDPARRHEQQRRHRHRHAELDPRSLAAQRRAVRARRAQAVNP